MYMSFLPKNSIRVGLAVVGVLGAIFAPWWVPVVCMLALSIRYRAWEVLFIGLISDLLWLAPAADHQFPILTLLGVVLVWIFEPLRVRFLVRR